MNAMFEVFLEFCGKKYDICIEEDKQSINFRAIYPKLQQVIKISANEDIYLLTHEFEILSPGAITHHTVKDLDIQVKNRSLIRIKSSKIPDEVPKLIEMRQKVEDFHSIVMAINIGWDFRKQSGQNRRNWQRVSHTLKRNPTRHRAHHRFLDWIQYYAQNYYEFEGKIGPYSQTTFDLLKVVHVLDLDKFNIFWHTRERIKVIARTVLESDYYRQHLAHIREKKIQEKESQLFVVKGSFHGLNNNNSNSKNNSNLGPKPKPLNISQCSSLRSPLKQMECQDSRRNGISLNKNHENSGSTAMTEKRNDEKRQRSH